MTKSSYIFEGIRRLAAILALWILSAGSFAQLPHYDKIAITIPGTEPTFTRAIQDGSGYLWFSASQGLYRYDGLSFRHYPCAAPEAGITALCAGPEGAIWSGCSNGQIFRLVQGKQEPFAPEEGTAGVAVTDLVCDSQGRLWWSTAGEGIYVFTGKRVFNFNHEDGLKDDYVYDLECTANDMIYAGTDAGLFVCSFSDEIKHVSPAASGVNLPDVIVRVVKCDVQGRVWLGFQDGAPGFLDPGLTRFEKAFHTDEWPYGPVQDIALPSGSAWIATAQGHILEVTGTGSEARHPASIAPADPGKIHDILEDQEGNIWICASRGLFRSTGNRLRFLNRAGTEPLGHIHALRVDASNPHQIWFGNDQGLFSIDLASGQKKKYLGNFHAPDLKFTCLMQDRYGFFWAGTFNYGVFRISPSDGNWTRITEAEGLVNNNVLSVSHHADTIWMATLGGASELVLGGSSLDAPYRITSFDDATGLVNNFIYSVYEDGRNQVWLATDGDGISVRTRTGWVNYSEKQGLADDVIYAVTGDREGTIWAASASNGVFSLRDGQFVQYGTDKGLSSLSVSAITVVNDELLIVNDNGIDVLHIPTGEVASYGAEAGLAGISPDLNVISTDGMGNVWAGTSNGLVRYRPGADSTAYGPKTIIEEMAVYLEPVPMSDGKALKYNENHVSFRYAGIWHSNPGGVNYQVFLEGYDLGWKDTYDRLVTYSSLEPGDYTFRVRTSLASSFSGAHEVSFRFSISEPFWLRDWFIILLILVVAGLVYLIIFIRENKLRKKEREKKEKVEFEFQVLKNQVNPHFLFNSFSTLMSLIEDQPDQAIQYTEKLSDFFRIILQYKDQEVIGLQEELALIESYFFLMKKRYGDNLNLEISIDAAVKKSFIPPMTLQILIENAIKHNIISRDKPLFIKVYSEGRNLVAENNLQPKLTAEVSTGIGLDNIRKRYRLIHSEEPEIEKTDDTYRVKLPVIL